MKMLRKLGAVLLFAALTLAVLAAANFCWWTMYTPTPARCCRELYADAGKIDTLFWGRPTVTAVSTPMPMDAALGTYSFNAGSSQQLPDGSYTCCGKPPRKIN